MLQFSLNCKKFFTPNYKFTNAGLCPNKSFPFFEHHVKFHAGRPN
mgnify:CR=1 FL=1